MTSFDILHFPGKISKYDPLEKFDHSWKKVNFYPGSHGFQCMYLCFKHALTIRFSYQIATITLKLFKCQL